ncbi:hypothetical protein DPMN_155140 [Dreissena polymorpha]|uniref:Uncharacterized protein n=1 Tax=Dreissena polymorpha TaxID=45954 RepID=A0A9D4FMC7_DREPO|nr:hypothetical protein DPMN_155140 [Dreissena polymorpha]
MSKQQRAAILLRQAADLLNVNTIPAPAPVTSVSSTSAAKAIVHPTVTEGGMDMQIRELWQCQHWTITPRCNQVGITKEACVKS